MMFRTGQRAQVCEQALRSTFNTTRTLNQYKLFCQWERGREPEETDPHPGDDEDSETYGEGWETDSSCEDWQEEDQHSDLEEYDEGDYTAPWWDWLLQPRKPWPSWGLTTG